MYLSFDVMVRYGFCTAVGEKLNKIAFLLISGLQNKWVFV